MAPNFQLHVSTFKVNNCRHRLNFIFAKSWPRCADSVKCPPKCILRQRLAYLGQPQGLFPVFILPSRKGGLVGNTRLPCAKMLLVPMNISSDGLIGHREKDVIFVTNFILWGHNTNIDFLRFIIVSSALVAIYSLRSDHIPENFQTSVTFPTKKSLRVIQIQEALFKRPLHFKRG